MEAVEGYTAAAKVKASADFELEKLAIRRRKPGAAVRIWENVLMKAEEWSRDAAGEREGGVLGAVKLEAAAPEVQVGGEAAPSESVSLEAAGGSTAAGSSSVAAAAAEAGAPAAATNNPWGLGSELKGAWGVYLAEGTEEEDPDVLSITARRQIEDQGREEERHAAWRKFRETDRSPSKKRTSSAYLGVLEGERNGGADDYWLHVSRPKTTGDRHAFKDELLLHMRAREVEHEARQEAEARKLSSLPGGPSMLAALEAVRAAAEAEEAERSMRRLGKSYLGSGGEDFRLLSKAATYGGGWQDASRDIAELMATKMGQINVLRAASTKSGERTPRDLLLLSAILRHGVPVRLAYIYNYTYIYMCVCVCVCVCV